MAKETPIIRFTVTVDYHPFKGEKTRKDFIRSVVESLARARMNHIYADGSLVRMVEVSKGEERDAQVGCSGMDRG